MSLKFYSYSAVGCALLMLGGCMTENPDSEGISFSGGNAIAHNTALQVIDPWPANVQDTHLIVPAERNSGADQAESSEQSTSTTSVELTAVD